ncbi:MAG: hypothetical protein QOI24_3328 [Acidobacteriota bacterium]|jgi:hypothetical protein|nr:hypothetical protein [Acidobacteriota bacterium]
MAEYALKGPQVQPDASYWGFCPKPCIVPLEELLKKTDNPNDPDYFPPWDERQVEREFEELVWLSRHRDDPCALVSTKPCKALPDTCRSNAKVEIPRAYDCRRPISRLLNLPPPIGAPLMHRLPGQQIIRTGRGMARAVESETPGLYHRNALNYLITLRHWSPPRQALVWAALDVAIASALEAAWYYKWLSPRDHVSRRQRPVEFRPLDVLFDCPDELNPAYNLCPDGRPKKGEPCGPNGSGTPRHPAYPSGHSTYSGAASEILDYFFGNECTPDELPHDERLESELGKPLKVEIDNMADNIGMGRLWAGIHWRSDHEAGMKLGRTVGRMVIQQLLDIGSVDDNFRIQPFILCPKEPKLPENQCDGRADCDMTLKPPPRDLLERKREVLEKHCGEHKGKCHPCEGKPCDDKKHTHASIDANRSANRGGE